MTDTLAAQIEALAADICRGVAEIPNRSSPDDEPDMMLVTADELMSLITEYIQESPTIVAALGQAEGNVPNLNSYIDGYEDAQEVAALRQAEAAPVMRTWANATEDQRERLTLLADIELHLQSCRVFLTSREKMHPCGVEIHDELLTKVSAAIEAISSEKVS